VCVVVGLERLAGVVGWGDRCELFWRGGERGEDAG
jgi:hypothetical protein